MHDIFRQSFGNETLFFLCPQIEGKKVRIVRDEEQEKYYFSVVDIVQVLTGSFDYQQARKYWKVLKGRLIKEGNETVTNCYQLKLPAAEGRNNERRKCHKNDVCPCVCHFFVVTLQPKVAKS